MVPYFRPSESLPAKEILRLIGKQLSDALADGDTALLEFNHRHGDAIHVEHEIRPALMVAVQGDFLDDHEVVVLRMFPVDELDALRHLARLDLHRDAIPQHGIDRFVVVVEATVRVLRLDTQEVDGATDLFQRVAGLNQVGGKQLLVDVAVVGPIRAVPKVAVVQGIAEEGDHPVLRLAFWFDDLMA